MSMGGMAFLRFRTLLYGTSRWRHNPREYQHIDLRSARPQQCAGAGVNRGPGFEHVINQDNLDLMGRRGQKCDLDVVGALGSRPSDLSVARMRLSPPCVMGTQQIADIARERTAD